MALKLKSFNASYMSLVDMDSFYFDLRSIWKTVYPQ
ncbi:hypothetical protein ACHAXS_002616 [Conticribra weissflogii]